MQHAALSPADARAPVGMAPSTQGHTPRRGTDAVTQPASLKPVPNPRSCTVSGSAFPTCQLSGAVRERGPHVTPGLTAPPETPPGLALLGHHSPRTEWPAQERNPKTQSLKTKSQPQILLPCRSWLSGPQVPIRIERTHSARERLTVHNTGSPAHPLNTPSETFFSGKNVTLRVTEGSQQATP